MWKGRAGKPLLAFRSFDLLQITQKGRGIELQNVRHFQILDNIKGALAAFQARNERLVFTDGVSAFILRHAKFFSLTDQKIDQSPVLF